MSFEIIYAADRYWTQKMCDNVILGSSAMLKPISVFYKNQKLCNKVVDNYAHTLESVLDYHKTQKCVKKLPILMQCNLFLIDIRLKKSEVEILMFVFLFSMLFSIDLRLKKCVMKLFPKKLLR